MTAEIAITGCIIGILLLFTVAHILGVRERRLKDRRKTQREQDFADGSGGYDEGAGD